MMKNIKNTVLIVLTVAAVVGFGTYAFADWGMSHHRYGWEQEGPGYHNRDWGRSGYGCRMADLSDDDVEMLKKERESFFKATEDFRQDIYTKELELKSELSKKTPDANKAIKLQKELSALEAKIDQRRIDHMIKIKKINPNAGRGPGPGWGRGSGKGYCWR